MRMLVRALIVLAVASAPSLGVAKAVVRAPHDSAPASSSIPVLGTPSWTADGQPQGGAELGFSPLSVTQSGVAYSPAATTEDPPADDQSKIADLPAWASSYFKPEEARDIGRRQSSGVHDFGALGEPLAWTLILVGVFTIGAAFRGFITANRRLRRLREGDEHQD